MAGLSLSALALTAFVLLLEQPREGVTPGAEPSPTAANRVSSFTNGSDGTRGDGAASAERDEVSLPHVATPAAAHIPASTAERLLSLTILLADGRPAEHASVAIAPHDEAPHPSWLATSADEQGRCELQGWDGPAIIRVGGCAPFPPGNVIERALGDHTITLAGEARISGRVLVDGRVPRERFAVALEGPGAYEPFGWLPWDPPLHAALPGHASSRLLNSRFTEADGSFRFFAPADWSGELCVSGAGSDERLATLSVTAPAEGLVVELASLPASLEGRVLTEQGEPAASSAVLCTWKLPTDCWLTEVTTDAEGSFRTRPPRAEEVVEAWLELRHAASGGMLMLDTGLLDPRHGKNLGDLWLVPARRLRLVVRDAAGEPVPDAHVLVGDAPERHLIPTDASGRLELSFPAGTPSCRVIADGFLDEIVPLDREDAADVSVTLRSPARLRVEVTCSGRPLGPCAAGSIELRVDAQDTLWDPDGGTGLRTCRSVRWSWPQFGGIRSVLPVAAPAATASFAVGSEPVDVWPLQPGRSLTVRLIDRTTATTLWEPRDVVVAAGETQPLEIPLTCWDLDVLAIDEQGDPAVHVLLQPDWPGDEWWDDVKTTGTGPATLGPLPVWPAGLRISGDAANDYVDLTSGPSPGPLVVPVQLRAPLDR